MAKRSSFNIGQFITDNPFISLIVLGGVSYVGYSVYRNFKKKKAGSVEESEKNPFNYSVFMKNAEAKASNKKQKIKSFSADDTRKFAEKLYKTWNNIGFDYPEEAVVIIKNMPSKYDFSKVLVAYNSKYGSDYQASIKDNYNEDNYNKVMETALDIAADYRF
jgi:hypothetical protein